MFHLSIQERILLYVENFTFLITVYLHNAGKRIISRLIFSAISERQYFFVTVISRHSVQFCVYIYNAIEDQTKSAVSSPAVRKDTHLEQEKTSACFAAMPPTGIRATFLLHTPKYSSVTGPQPFNDLLNWRPTNYDYQLSLRSAHPASNFIWAACTTTNFFLNRREHYFWYCFDTGRKSASVFAFWHGISCQINLQEIFLFCLLSEKIHPIECQNIINSPTKIVRHPVMNVISARKNWMSVGTTNILSIKRLILREKGLFRRKINAQPVSYVCKCKYGAQIRELSFQLSHMSDN